MKPFAATGLAVAISLLAVGCSAPAGPAPETAPSISSPAVTKPLPKEGKEIIALAPVEVSVAPDYKEATGADDQGVQDAIKLGLDSLKVFTYDFAQYQTLDKALNQEQLLALLPEAEAKMKPLMNEGTLKNFSEKWKAEASNPDKLENISLLLLTTGGENATNWKNKENLECGISNAELAISFTNPRLEAITPDGLDYKVTAFKADGHYYIPCADGKVMKQDVAWELLLGPSSDGSKWELYTWTRKLTGDASYVQ